jgi:hypothetical protein
MVLQDAGYFLVQFRRVNPRPYKQVYTILGGISGKVQYVGTYLAWGVHNNGWWGEGENKFYLDGDKEFPTLSGKGTEDNFGGSYNFKNQENNQYETFTMLYSGVAHDIKPDGLYQSQQSGDGYLPLMDDISSVAYWHQTEPHAHFPEFSDKDHLEVN